MKKYLIPMVIVGMSGIVTAYCLHLKRIERIQKHTAEIMINNGYLYGCLVDGYKINYPEFNLYMENNNLRYTSLLVIKYSLFSCKPCVDFLIDLLKEKIPDFGSDKRIVFLLSGYNVRTVPDYPNTVFIRNSSITGEYFWEQTDEPMVFVYNDGIRHSFIPIPDYPNIFSIYLDMIMHRYF